MIKKVLRRIREGGEMSTVARDLGLERGTLQAILEMAVKEGYVEKVEPALGCANCSFWKTCVQRGEQAEKARMYVLTPKGEEFANT